MFFNPYTGKFGDGSLQGFHRSLAGLGDASDLNSVACPMDAKICPDGTTVGRVPPGCSFAPCPSSPATAGTPLTYMDGLYLVGANPVNWLTGLVALPTGGIPMSSGSGQRTWAFAIGAATPGLVAIGLIGYMLLGRKR